jgi:hypothetical protein
MALDPQIETESSAVRSEIFSANSQASTVLAAVSITTGLLASEATALFYRSWPIIVMASAGAITLFAAVWLLLDVVLPRLDASGKGSFLYWARCDRTTLSEAIGADFQLDELLVMSRIAAAKYTALRRAGHLLKLSLVLFIAAALLSATT